MQFIHNLIADSLNGFSLRFIPYFLFQLICAGLFAHIMQMLMNRKAKEVIVSNAALIAVFAALITSIVKFSLPFSILGAAALLLFLNFKRDSQLANLGMTLSVGVGIGCGVGSVVQTLLGVIVLGLVLLFSTIKKQ